MTGYMHPVYKTQQVIMRILLSNDDGVHAPGIQTLAKALREFADVQVVAPDRNRSGASNSLTLESSLRTFTFENGDIAVQMGTPISDTGILPAHVYL